MKLYYLISNVWRFSIAPKYETGSRMPSASIWTFDLDGFVSFQGETFGEGHPMLFWNYDNDCFYIESHRYGLIEFKMDRLMINLLGKSTLNHNSSLSFKGEIFEPLNDKLFYQSFKSYLKRIWRIFMLGTRNLLYFEFGEDEVILFDAFGLKKMYYETSGMQDLDVEDELKSITYIYKLEMQSIILFKKDNMQKVGVINLDDNKNLAGLFTPPFYQREYFISLSEMTDILTKEVVLEVGEDQRIF